MVRTPFFDKSGLKKGTWTPEEDRKLIAYVARYGHWNWRLVPKFAGLARCGKSCRLRWLNYLRPNIKRGNYTQEEEETIIKLLQHLGKRWSVIATQLPGRTDNEIKNYWHANLKKRFQQNWVTWGKPQASKSKDPYPAEPLPNNSIMGPLESFSATSRFPNSLQSSTCHTAVASNKSLVSEDEFMFLDAYEESIIRNFLLDDSLVEPMPNNIIGPFQSLPATSQSTDSCRSTTPSSSSEFSITTDHTIASGNKKLVPEDVFAFLDASEESGNFLLDHSPVEPIPNNIIHPFQKGLPTTPQSTKSCPFSISEDEYPFMDSYREPMIESLIKLDHSPIQPMPNNVGHFQNLPATTISNDSCLSFTPSYSNEFSITTDHNHTTVADNINLVPEDEFAFLDASDEPMNGSFLLDDSPVEPISNNIICPFQNLPATSQSTDSCSSSMASSSSELLITTFHTQLPAMKIWFPEMNLLF